MADDDGGDWFADAADDVVPEPTPAAAAEAKPEAAKAADGEKPPEEGAPAAEEPEAQEYIDPNKLLIFKHWIR